jgi:YVTN family beta-propeller protein
VSRRRLYRYTLYRSDLPGIEAQPDSAEVLRTTLDAEDTVFSDLGARWDSTYYYALETLDSEGLVSWSNEVELDIPPMTSFGGPDMLIATVDVGAGPGGIISLPSGDLACVACYYGGELCVIRSDYPYNVATVPVNGSPFDVCASEDHVFASCAQGDEVVSVRTSDYTVESYSTVGDMPTGICITPDGKRVYVCCCGSDEVWCLDALTLSVIDIIPAGDGPWDICSLPAGEYIYLTCRQEGRVQVVRTSDSTIVAVVDVDEPTGASSSAAGEHVYVCNYSTDEVTSIRTSDNSVESSIDVGTRPMNVATTPNGLLAYATCYFDDRTYLIDLATDIAVGFMEVGTRPNGVCLTSSGEYLFVSNSSSNTVSVFDYCEE